MAWIGITLKLPADTLQWIDSAHKNRSLYIRELIDKDRARLSTEETMFEIADRLVQRALQERLHALPLTSVAVPIGEGAEATTDSRIRQKGRTAIMKMMQEREQEKIGQDKVQRAPDPSCFPSYNA